MNYVSVLHNRVIDYILPDNLDGYDEHRKYVYHGHTYVIYTRGSGFPRWTPHNFRQFCTFILSCVRYADPPVFDMFVVKYYNNALVHISHSDPILHHRKWRSEIDSWLRSYDN